jgi:hypothetical protein
MQFLAEDQYLHQPQEGSQDGDVELDCADSAMPWTASRRHFL